MRQKLYVSTVSKKKEKKKKKRKEKKKKEKKKIEKKNAENMLLLGSHLWNV